MSQSEKDAILEAAAELMRNSGGGSILAAGISDILHKIATRYGNDSNVEAACNALDDLSGWIEAAKQEMRRAAE